VPWHGGQRIRRISPSGPIRGIRQPGRRSLTPPQHRPITDQERPVHPTAGSTAPLLADRQRVPSWLIGSSSTGSDIARDRGSQAVNVQVPAGESSAQFGWLPVRDQRPVGGLEAVSLRRALDTDCPGVAWLAREQRTERLGCVVGRLRRRIRPADQPEVVSLFDAPVFDDVEVEVRGVEEGHQVGAGRQIEDRPPRVPFRLSRLGPVAVGQRLALHRHRRRTGFALPDRQARPIAVHEIPQGRQIDGVPRLGQPGVEVVRDGVDLLAHALLEGFLEVGQPPLRQRVRHGAADHLGRGTTPAQALGGQLDQRGVIRRRRHVRRPEGRDVRLVPDLEPVHAAGVMGGQGGHEPGPPGARLGREDRRPAHRREVRRVGQVDAVAVAHVEPRLDAGREQRIDYRVEQSKV